MRRPLKQSLFAILCLTTALLTSACGGGGSSDDSSSSAGLGILLTDAPTDGLAVVEMDLLAIQLRRTDGSFTANLLPVRRTYDVLGLAGTRSLLALVNPPAGSYDGVRVQIDPASVRIYASGGGAVGVRVERAIDVATFAARGEGSLTLGTGFHDLLIDIDLSKSLAEDPLNPGGKLFELEVEAEHEFEDEEMDEFRGRVTTKDPSNGSFLVTLLDDSGAPFGAATVLLEAGDALIDDDGTPFASLAAFFAALQSGDEVEVHGTLTSAGRVNATRVEIEDGFSLPIKLKGDVLSVNAGAQEFEFLLKEVRRGSQSVYQTLAQLGNPRVLRIAWNAETSFAVEDGGPASAAALVPGAELYVGFTSFTPPMPFLAGAVEFDDEGASFEGIISSVAGLPGSFTLSLDQDEPAWLSGAVTGPISVSLATVNQIFLDTETEPVLDANALLVGLKVEVHGALSGPPNAATIAASRLKLKPGRLDGTITGVNLAGRTITVQVSDVDDPFGGPALGANVTAMVPVAAWIEGDTGPMSLSAVQSLLAGLGVGETLGVRLEGIGDGAGAVTGWELEVEVEL
ncbi:MAG: DUF5666 domain-containing protein [Planctomycetota bacterium]|nr:DUF5666 domain-containing protein [Planctomycetota bacterium]